MHWYLDVLKKYAVFQGRARRTEYWVYTLVSVAISLLLSYLDTSLKLGFLEIIYSLLVLVPTLAVIVRRLHDTGRSGWWILIVFVPFVGGIVLLIFMLLDSEPMENQYGPNPKVYEG